MTRRLITRSVAALSACLGVLSASAPSFALDPAVGPPTAAAAPVEAEAAADTAALPAPPALAALPAATDNGASGARSWLARPGGNAAIEPAVPPSSGTSTGLTLGAVVIVLGLAGAAIYLRFKRQTALPITPSESRLTVLSSSRVGPKAYAVTAHVGGRVLLLGVTDHSVSNLGWLDPREPEAAPRAEQDAPLDEEDDESDELPDDYPGSALRASKPPPAFATTHELRRFQEVLRGAVSSRTELPMRPSYAPSQAPDAAVTLAAQTRDVVNSVAPPSLGTPAPAVVQNAVSLRRKRRGRESIAPREPRVTASSRAPKAADRSFEGQVAGLRALRNNG